MDIINVKVVEDRDIGVSIFDNEQINVKIEDNQEINVHLDGTSGSLSQHFHLTSDITDINGKLNEVTYLAGDLSGIGGHRVVYLDENKKLQYATSNDLIIPNKVLGVTLNAGAYNTKVTVKTSGEITDSSFNWQIDLPLYLSYNGLITQTYPSDSLVCKIIGYAINTNTMIVDLRQLIIK